MDLKGDAGADLITIYINTRFQTLKVTLVAIVIYFILQKLIHKLCVREDVEDTVKEVSY